MRILSIHSGSLFLTLLAIVVAGATPPIAQQRYSVYVPLSSSMTAPPDVEITKQVDADNQSFPPQRWTIGGNNPLGVVVSFATSLAFTLTTDPSFKSDAELSLTLHTTHGPANWSVVQAVDSTDVTVHDEVATVQAASDGVGKADVELTTRFLVDPLSALPPGIYELMVVSTVTIP
jgi:hypothetical protein